MKKFYIAAVAYLYFPIMLFLCMWLKIWVSIPLAVITLIALVFGIKKMAEEESQTSFVKIGELLFVFCCFCLLFVFCGEGDLIYQDFDWHKHHAILRDLVNYQWPVIYDNDVLLTYYIGQYIVPALFGKIFGCSMLIAIWTLVVWNALGLTLSYIFICQYLKTSSAIKKFLVFFVMILWSGAPNLGSALYQLIGHDAGLSSFKWIDIDRVRVHFASNLNALRGAFQHVIVPWVSCSIFMNHKKSYAVYLLLGLPLFFSATFGFIYFAGILIAYSIWNLTVEKAWKTKIQEIFSKENLMMIPLLLVLLIYMSGNIFGEKPDILGIDLLNMFVRFDFYLIFVLAEFIGYSVFLFREHRKNALFYIIVLELLFIPFISLGMWNDLCSRGSIPARFILMIFCMEQIFKYKWKNWRNYIIALIFFIGVHNEVIEIQHVMYYTKQGGFGSEQILADSYYTLNGVAANMAYRVDEAYNYYTLHYSESIFYKIARNNR